MDPNTNLVKILRLKCCHFMGSVAGQVQTGVLAVGKRRKMMRTKI